MQTEFHGSHFVSQAAMGKKLSYQLPTLVVRPRTAIIKLKLAWSCIENVLMVFGRVDPKDHRSDVWPPVILEGFDIFKMASKMAASIWLYQKWVWIAKFLSVYMDEIVPYDVLRH